MFAVLGLSIIPFTAIIIASDFRQISWMNLVVARAFSTPVFYLTVLVTVGACVLLDLVFHFYAFAIKPSLVNYLLTLINEGRSL